MDPGRSLVRTEIEWENTAMTRGWPTGTGTFPVSLNQVESQPGRPSASKSSPCWSAARSRPGEMAIGGRSRPPYIRLGGERSTCPKPIADDLRPMADDVMNVSPRYSPSTPPFVKVLFRRRAGRPALLARRVGICCRARPDREASRRQTPDPTGRRQGVRRDYPSRGATCSTKSVRLRQPSSIGMPPTSGWSANVAWGPRATHSSGVRMR